MIHGELVPALGSTGGGAALPSATAPALPDPTDRDSAALIAFWKNTWAPTDKHEINQNSWVRTNFIQLSGLRQDSEKRLPTPVNFIS